MWGLIRFINIKIWCLINQNGIGIRRIELINKKEWQIEEIIKKLRVN